MEECFQWSWEKSNLIQAEVESAKMCCNWCGKNVWSRESYVTQTYKACENERYVKIMVTYFIIH